MLKSLDSMYPLSIVNKIKLDSLEFERKLGAGIDFISMIENGLIQVVGEKEGELLYESTKSGMCAVGVS
jgi:hypothetical protein